MTSEEEAFREVFDKAWASALSKMINLGNLCALGLAKFKTYCVSCGTIEKDGEYIMERIGWEGQGMPINECKRCGAINSFKTETIYAEGFHEEI